MSDPFIAEIRIFPFNFAPSGWAICDGQLMGISQNRALFSLLGTTFGGDGKSTFALPNLQGSVPMQPGQGQGLSLRDLGEKSGTDHITLLASEIPMHTHTVQVSNQTATLSGPEGNVPARIAYDTGTTSGTGVAYSATAPTVQMAPQALSMAGGGLPHNNLQPYLVLTFCIAMQGIFPPRP